MINKIKKLREYMGYTQEQLAYICGVKRETICRLERNEHYASSSLCQKLELALDGLPYLLEPDEISDIIQRKIDIGFLKK